MDYSQLKSGYQFPTSRIDLDRDAVAAYRQAVEDASPLYDEKDLVPATAVAAFALRELLAHLELHPGSVHVFQELDFHRACQVGESLTVQGTVAQNAARGGWRFLAVDQRVADESGALALEGRSTILFPPEEA